jgi:hypothetical protein
MFSGRIEQHGKKLAGSWRIGTGQREKYGRRRPRGRMRNKIADSGWVRNELESGVTSGDRDGARTLPVYKGP